MSRSASNEESYRVSVPTDQTPRAGTRSSRAPDDLARYTGIAHSRRVVAAERWLLRRLLRQLGNPPVKVLLWSGEAISADTGPAVAKIVIHDRPTLLKLISNPVVGFGDAYTEGRLEIEGDLLEFLRRMYVAMPQPRKNARWLNRSSANTIAGSRENIHRHYDIGNDFYKLWLDEELVYTCAYFPHEQASLEEAQQSKMEYVCRKLRLQPGDRVVEAGCGWGSLALYMASKYGVSVNAYNISEAQISSAQARARAERLDSRVKFIQDDYRNITGEYDVFVSVGMLEHVRSGDYSEFRDVIDRCLSNRGRGLIHSIGRNRPGEFNPWIERRIFPGAYPPALREMLEILEPLNLCVQDVENLRLHYAKTIEHWLSRFESSAGTVAKMFDEKFVRAWRLYLTGALAGFLTGTLQLFQIVFARQGVNDVPWTRAQWYRGWNGESDAVV